MPTSHPESRKWVKRQFMSISPRTVLDVGIGEGTYSRLLRRADQHWIGIEAWSPYVEQYALRDIYDEIIVDDFRGMSVHADLAIVGDCLEHVPHEDGEEYLGRLMRECAAIILVLPLGECPQGAVNENPFEEHRATWTDSEVRAILGKGLNAIFRGEVVGGYFWQR